MPARGPPRGSNRAGLERESMQVRTERSRSGRSDRTLGGMTTALRSGLDDAALLLELEPEVHRLYDRHAGMAQEWFPHEFIPYRLGGECGEGSRAPAAPRLAG